MSISQRLKWPLVFGAGVLTGVAAHKFLTPYVKLHSFTTYSKSSKRADVPDNAPEECPGVTSERAGKSVACEGCPNQQVCSSGEAAKGMDTSAVCQRLASVRWKLIVISGKGGVGKSTVATQLAWALSGMGMDVGLLDVDICGPSAPLMMGVRSSAVHQSGTGWSPVYVRENLAVMSIGFLLPDEDDAVIWRGPKKNGLIRQFLSDVDWGKLDFLVVDTPPGTSDEHLSVVTFLAEAGIDGAIVVTTPQEAALVDVRKEINFCRKVDIPILGVIENMTNSVFDEEKSSGGAETMCKIMGVPLLGRIPLDSQLTRACETGTPLVQLEDGDIWEKSDLHEGPASVELRSLVEAVVSRCALKG